MPFEHVGCFQSTIELRVSDKLEHAAHIQVPARKINRDPAGHMPTSTLATASFLFAVTSRLGNGQRHDRSKAVALKATANWTAKPRASGEGQFEPRVVCSYTDRS